MREREVMLATWLISLAGLLTGCPGPATPGPILIARPVLVGQDTFGFEPQWWDKNIAHVRVVAADRSDPSQPSRPPAWIGPCAPARDDGIEDIPPFTTRWALRAVTPVSARDFRLTPGRVPEGFEQVFPAGSETFTPGAGETYYILVCLEPVQENFYSVAATWEPAKTRTAPPSRTTITVEGPFMHEPSGMVFPVEVGRFQRTMVESYDARGRDVGVGYRLPSLLRPTIITAYVYPIPPEHIVRPSGSRTTLDPDQSLLHHFRDARRQILGMYKDARGVSEQDVSHESRGKVYAGKMLVFEHEGRWMQSTAALRSYLYLFGPVADTWMIKYRITHPQSVDASEEIDEFLRALTWTIERS